MNWPTVLTKVWDFNIFQVFWPKISLWGGTCFTQLTVCDFTVLTVEIISTVWEDVLICNVAFLNIKFGIPFLRTTWITITLKIWQFRSPNKTWGTKINSVNTGVNVFLRWEAGKWWNLRVVLARIHRWRP